MRNGKFNNKAMETNRNLKQFFIEKNIFLVVWSTNFSSKKHCKSKLPLNKSGTSILSSNFVRSFSNILD